MKSKPQYPSRYYPIHTRWRLWLMLFAFPTTSLAQSPQPAMSGLLSRVDKKAEALHQAVISWRRDFHQHPELGNREFRTAAKIAAHLRALGLEVHTGVAKTGVVGLLWGGKHNAASPGRVVALRADMDGLPVVERVELPFKSTVVTQYNGQSTGVMHACGHDAHVAILMGVAQVLASVRDELRGTVKFIFQPAEEGAPEGETGGAEVMVQEGVLANPAVDVIFGLHIKSELPINSLSYRPGPLMAAVDDLHIDLMGQPASDQRLGSGNDLIFTASQLVLGLQTIVSRTVNLTQEGAVITVGTIDSEPATATQVERVKLWGTIRSFSPLTQQLIHRRIEEVASSLARSARVKAIVTIDGSCPLTFNDPQLTKRSVPVLERLTSKSRVLLTTPTTLSEDFSYFQQQVPGFFFFLGGKSPNTLPTNVAAHHTPDFQFDESGMGLGVKALSLLAIDYMNNGPIK